MNEKAHQQPFPVSGGEEPSWRKLSSDFVSEAEFEGEKILKIDADALELLAREAFHDISHLLRPAHLAQLKKTVEAIDASRSQLTSRLVRLSEEVNQLRAQ